MINNVPLSSTTRIKQKTKVKHFLTKQILPIENRESSETESLTNNDEEQTYIISNSDVNKVGLKINDLYRKEKIQKREKDQSLSNILKSFIDNSNV